MMASTDLGLMKIATGKSPATCSRLMALPLTSRIQCLPWRQTLQFSGDRPLFHIQDTVFTLETDTAV